MVRVRLSSPVDADVVIVGAGPAGCAAAWHLRQRGYSVLLTDRSAFPRDKVCGDFVGPVAIAEAAAMGVTSLPEFGGANTIHRAAVFLDGRCLIEQAIPQIGELPGTGRVIPRTTFDEWLFRVACRSGARPMLGWSARAFEVRIDRVEVLLHGATGERRLSARLLIGADGSGSAIARSLRGSMGRPARRIVALRAYFEGVRSPDDRCDLFFSQSSFPGYYWLFPTGDSGANVGIGMLVETLPIGETHLRELLHRAIESDVALHARLAHATLRGPVVGWPLQTYDPGAPLVGQRVLLVGDAAGLINPLNGEGIQYAMLSGRWAAESVGSELHHGGDLDSALERYADRVQRELRYDMALSNVIVELIRNRYLAPVWLHFLATITSRAKRSPRYARITGGVLAGLLPAHEALTPTVLMGTAQQELARLAIGAGLNVISGPSRAGRTVGDLAKGAMNVGLSCATRPLASAVWAAGVGVAAAELATQAAVATLRARQTSGPKAGSVKVGPWR